MKSNKATKEQERHIQDLYLSGLTIRQVIEKSGTGKWIVERVIKPIARSRYARHGTIISRFESSFIPEPNTGCWLWISGDNGYPMIYHRSTQMRASRVAWELRNGKPMPASLFACHKCDTPECVNPDHIFAGTQKENMQDCARKGRAGAPERTHTHCQNGHPWTKENTGRDGKRKRCKTCTNTNYAKRKAAKDRLLQGHLQPSP